MSDSEANEDKPGESEDVEHDTAYSPGSERETEVRQRRPRHSAATKDDEIEGADIKVLPGTGGPDDYGDIEVNPDDIHLN